MYGIGFFVFALAVGLDSARWVKLSRKQALMVIVLICIAVAWLLPTLATSRRPRLPLSIVGVQMEFPPEAILSRMLTQALTKNTNAQIFVLSEYTLGGPVPEALKRWCREHSRFLVVGGVAHAPNNFYNTAFVVDTNGDVVFQQVKSVPIQFFKDGLPAPSQSVWPSPWGKIGLCVCYDLSYTRVVDELVRQGAQLLIVPTMDVEYWGRHQHELHARVAPVRAAEYGIPIFRLTSSGISQAVDEAGQVVAQAPMPGNGAFLAARLSLPPNGVLPPDRFFAPICTGITVLVLLWLLWPAMAAMAGFTRNPLDNPLYAGQL